MRIWGFSHWRLLPMIYICIFRHLFWIGTWILHLSCNTVVPIEVSVRALAELYCIYWFTQLCPILNCNPDPGTRHKWPLNEWMIPWSSLNASFQRMLCGRPSACLSRPTLHLDPLLHAPAGWPVDQPQPPASLASPSIWQLGWVCTFIGLYVIGLAVFLSNTFSMQFLSWGSTNFPPLWLLPTQDLEGLPGATSHRYCTTPSWFPKLFLHEKCCAGRSTSWNQDCQEKYQ